MPSSSSARQLSPVDQALSEWNRYGLYVNPAFRFDLAELRQRLTFEYDLTGELLLPPSAPFETKKEAGTNPLPHHQYQNNVSSPDNLPSSRQGNPSATSGLIASHATGPGAVAGHLRDRWQNQKEPSTYVQYSMAGIAGPTLVPERKGRNHGRIRRILRTGLAYDQGWSWELAGQLLARPDVKERLADLNRRTQADPAVRAFDRKELSYWILWSKFAPFHAANIMALGTDKIQAELGCKWDAIRVNFDTARKTDRKHPVDPARRKASSNTWRLIELGLLHVYSLATLGLTDLTEADQGLGLAQHAPAWPSALDDLQELHTALLQLPAGQGKGYFGARCIQYNHAANFYRLPDWVREAVDQAHPDDVNPFGHMADPTQVQIMSKQSPLTGDMNPVLTSFGHNSDLVLTKTGLEDEIMSKPSQNYVGLYESDLINEYEYDRAHAREGAEKEGDEGRSGLNPLQKEVEKRLKSAHHDITYGATFIKPAKITELVTEQGCTLADIDEALGLIRRDIARNSDREPLKNPTGLFLTYLNGLLAQRAAGNSVAVVNHKVHIPVRPDRRLQPVQPKMFPAAQAMLDRVSPSVAEETVADQFEGVPEMITPVFPASKLNELWQEVNAYMIERYEVDSKTLESGRFEVGNAPDEIVLILPSGSSTEKIRISQALKAKLEPIYNYKLIWQ